MVLFKKVLFICAFLFSCFIFGVKADVILPPVARMPIKPVRVTLPPVITRIPRITTRSDYKQMVIQDLSVKTNIIGNIATTTYEMTILNPNAATLEAEFTFPLTENQTVAAVALDINGKMRDGVVVEKEKARQTFEAVVRQGADPLLVEKTSGNQFKTRIYPFSPNGTRKIRIVLEEALNKKDGAYFYELPLTFGQKLANFYLDIEIPTESEDLPEIATNIPGFKFNKSGAVIRSEFSAKDYKLNNTLSFKIPVVQKEQVFTHNQGNRTYFYGTFDAQKSTKNKVLPKNLAIIWDASLSGSKRDIAREKALLLAYLKKIKNVNVNFIPFNIEQGKTQKFTIKNGDTSALKKHLDKIVYDGATKFNTLKLNEVKADELLMFTDGITTFAKDDPLILPQKPLYIISSSNEFEPEKLKGWANQTFGGFINLNTLDENQALDKLMHQPLRIIKYKKDHLSEVYPVIGTEVDGNVSFAGILKGEKGELEIDLGYDENNITQTHKMALQKGGDNSAVARLWAIQKINYLSQEPKKNKDTILKLGQKYSIVTDNTSLLVLENASDYWRYHITPPEDLRAEYDRLQKNANMEEKLIKDSAWDEALTMAKRVKEWWQKSFDINQVKHQKYEQLKAQSTSQPQIDSLEYSMDAAVAIETPRAMADVGFVERAVASSGVVRRRVSVSNGSVADAAIMASEGHVVAKPAAQQPQGKIQIKAWDPETPYLKILKASKDKELYTDYLKLKTGYADQPSFYFDIVDEFIRRGQNEKAMIVLSNISEMQLDNVELIRVAANKLIQMGQTTVAVELFEKITELRGEDPQSFRDLALAYQADGQYQKAFDTFYHIMETHWVRFNEIKQIVFVEMNNLLALHPEIDTKDMNKEFIFAMPVDIRIVLGWSTDNTDIDLHVVDPIGEECYYGHKETQIGGRYPHDFTQGFGPEEFMLKKAANGKYVVRTNNFGDHRQSISGPSTLYLDLYTNYGREDQKHERLLVRAGQVKDKNEIGDITWSGNTDEEDIEE